MEAPPAGSLLSFLATIPDPRSRHGRQHPLSAVLALVCCAMMCGAKSYTAIAQWAHDQDIGLMHRLGFTRRPPKMGGIRKILIALDLKAFEGGAEPVGRIVAGPADLEWSVATTSLRARWQGGSWQLRRPREGSPSTLLGGSGVGGNGGSDAGSQWRGEQDQRAQDSSPVASRHRSGRATDNRRRHVLPT